MKKLLLLIVGLLMFISVNAQVYYHQIYAKNICYYTDDNKLIECVTYDDNSLFELSGNFKYITRYIDSEVEYLKTTNVLRVAGTNIWRFDCYNMVTYNEYFMLFDYDKKQIFVEKTNYNNTSLVFYWSAAWKE